MSCLFSTLIFPVKNTSVNFNRDAYLDQSYSAYVLVITRECLQETQKESLLLWILPDLFSHLVSRFHHMEQRKYLKCT